MVLANHIFTAQFVIYSWNMERHEIKTHFYQTAQLEIYRHRDENRHLYPDEELFPTIVPASARRIYPGEITPEERNRIWQMLDSIWEESNDQLAAEEVTANDASQAQQAGEPGPFPNLEWVEHPEDDQDQPIEMPEEDAMIHLLRVGC